MACALKHWWGQQEEKHRVQKAEHLEKDNFPDITKTESTTFFLHSFNELLGSGLVYYIYTIIANSNYWFLKAWSKLNYT